MSIFGLLAWVYGMAVIEMALCHARRWVLASPYSPSMWISQLRQGVFWKLLLIKKQWIVLRYLRGFFSKRRFYDIVYACCIWLILPFYHNRFLYFSCIYNLSIIFAIARSIHARFFSIFVRDFFFRSFPLIS